MCVMKLDTYLRERDLTDEKFAEIVGVDRSAVTRWRNGTTCPETPNQRKIFERTNGEVTPNDFMGITAPVVTPAADVAAAPNEGAAA